VTLVSTEAGPDRDTYGRVLRAVEIDGDDVGQFLMCGTTSPTGSGVMPTRTPGLAAMHGAAESNDREESPGFWSTCDWWSTRRVRLGVGRTA
jgi:hypothetical protein